DAHARAARLGPWLRRFALVVCAAVVGWLNFHASDDVQPVAAALLVFGFGFGFGFGLRRPGRAWLYALLLFAAVPVSGAWAAAVKNRWGTSEVLIEDRGDSIVLWPLPADPIGAALHLLPAEGPTTDQIRAQLREEEAAAEADRLGKRR